MHLTGNSLLVMLLVGGIVGWLAGLIMRGSDYGVIGDIIIGLLGAVVSSYLLQAMNVSVHTGHPAADKAVVAFIGALVLMFVIGLFRPRTFTERLSNLFRRR